MARSLRARRIGRSCTSTEAGVGAHKIKPAPPSAPLLCPGLFPLCSGRSPASAESEASETSEASVPAGQRSRQGTEPSAECCLLAGRAFREGLRCMTDVLQNSCLPACLPGGSRGTVAATALPRLRHKVSQGSIIVHDPPRAQPRVSQQAANPPSRRVSDPPLAGYLHYERAAQLPTLTRPYLVRQY